MSNIIEILDKVKSRLSDEKFLQNKGLSNEVGIYVLCYQPEDEAIVNSFFEKLKTESGTIFHIVACNLYQIFLSICEDKRILKAIPSMEEKKGREFVMNQLQKIASPEIFIEKMKYALHNCNDILVISGVGEVYPFMRVHKILDNIQHIFEDIPVLVLYPGIFNGQELSLFGEMTDGNYYRAFNLL